MKITRSYMLFMFDYDVMKKKYGDRAHLFTHTDSRMDEVETGPIYADMVSAREMFDL